MKHKSLFKALAGVAVICFITVAVYSCKKKRSSYLWSYTIYNIGCEYPGNEIRFLYDNQNNPAHTFAWVFGDGTGSSEHYPVHIYSSSGLYTVTLTIDDDPSKMASLEILIAQQLSGSSFTANMSGVRLWNGSLNNFGSVQGPVPVVDTQLSVEIINAATIKCFMGEEMHLTGIDTTRKVLTFDDCFKQAHLIYYYAANSITYRFSRQVGKMVYKTVDIHTP